MNSERLAGIPSEDNREQLHNAGLAEFQRAREIDRPRELIIPKCPIYPLGSLDGWKNFITSLRTAPDRIKTLAPWKPESMKDDFTLFDEALEKNVIKDTFKEQLTDRAKSKRKKDFFEKKPKAKVLEIYLKWFNKPRHMVVAELPGKDGEGLFVPILAKEPFNETLYSRNFPIISKEEQEWLAGLTTAHAGMGVGGSAAKGLVKAGVQNFRVADGGTVILHDENRVTDADVANLMENHAIDWTVKAYHRNPHLNIECIPQNLGDGSNKTSNRTKFMQGADFLFEEVDDIREKVRLRQEAQRLGITVIMATDVGFGTVINVQRPDDPIFPGLTEEDWNIINSDTKISFEKASAMATRIIGPEYIKADYFNKAAEEGRSFWAQTGASADASAGAVVKTMLEIRKERLEGKKLVPTNKAYMLDDLKAA
ncbi:MAG: ThiF family adenylyltransferase [Candidatus Levybacteria bacterium]|nr:ThiF family adenylyltransferase [Candidatus Levybacteria bacterium]